MTIEEIKQQIGRSESAELEYKSASFDNTTFPSSLRQMKMKCAHFNVTSTPGEY